MRSTTQKNGLLSTLRMILEGILLLLLPKVAESFSPLSIHQHGAIAGSSTFLVAQQLPQPPNVESSSLEGVFSSSSLLMANIIPFVPDFYTICVLGFLGLALWGDFEEKLRASQEATDMTPETKKTNGSSVESTKEEVAAATTLDTSASSKKKIGHGVMFGGWVSSFKSEKNDKTTEPKELIVNDQESLADQVVDVSIPYDAPARLAYESGGYRGDYQRFRQAYEQRAVAQVMAKHRERITQAALEQAAAQTQHAAQELARFRKLQSEIVQAESTLQELL